MAASQQSRNGSGGIIKLRGNRHSQQKPKPRASPPRPQPSASAPSKPRRQAQSAQPYTTSRFCCCDRPMVVAERDHAFLVEADSRCLRCGKPEEPDAPENDPLPRLSLELD